MTQAQIKLIENTLEAIDEDSYYDDFLDEAYGNVTIAGLDYPTSQAQKEIDPIAYRCGKADVLDSECQDNNLIEVNEKFYRYDDVMELIKEDE